MFYQTNSGATSPSKTATPLTAFEASSSAGMVRTDSVMSEPTGSEPEPEKSKEPEEPEEVSSPQQPPAPEPYISDYEPHVEDDDEEEEEDTTTTEAAE